MTEDYIFGFNTLYNFFFEVITNIINSSIITLILPNLNFNPGWIAYILSGLTISMLVFNAILIGTALYTWFERRTLAKFQGRYGPNRWGPFGILQPIADGIKSITKEDIIPTGADKVIFTLAPILMLIPGLLVFAFIPGHINSMLGKINVGVAFVFGVTGMNTIAVIMAGWASRNKFAMFGAMRSAAMLISYEVPMALAIAGILLLSGSMSFNGIVEAQRIPFIFTQPIAFLVYMICATAEMSRAPFDMIEAESELGGGYHTEYSGMKFAILQISEFMAPIVQSALCVTLFLGGFNGPDFIPGILWLSLKIVLVLFVLLWTRSTWPRLRVDQIMELAWKYLLPLALLNILLVATEMTIFDVSQLASLWTMAIINWATMLIILTLLSLFNNFNKKTIQQKY
jgi:NADH-quinone oxidoreductase subunit H